MDNHIQFPCVEVEQGKAAHLYLGILSFEQLKALYTVSPRLPRKDDPYYSDLQDQEPAPFQRPQREDRLRKIARYISSIVAPLDETRKRSVFPGTLILGLLTDIEETPKLPKEAVQSVAYLCPDGNPPRKVIFLPKRENSLFVIDGQHRIAGLIRVLEDLDKTRPIAADDETVLARFEEKRKGILNFGLPISLLVDFDLDEQAVVFATVNFEQKPVQRSFYYDIFGAFEAADMTSLSFAHELVIHLQNSSQSPLRNMIKLLGSGPGMVSQAFVVERIIPLIDPGKATSVLRAFYSARYGGNVEGSKLFGMIIRNFFQAVKESFEYAWPIPRRDGSYSVYGYEFILCKSMVMSGLLGNLREIYKLALLDFAFGRELKVARETTFPADFFKSFLVEVDLSTREAIRRQPAEQERIAQEQSIFSRSSAWAVGGSSKIERIIFEAIRQNVFTAYKQMVRDPRSNYNTLVSKYAGSRKASALIDTMAERADEFWLQTERLWLSSFDQAQPTSSQPVSDQPPLPSTTK